MATTTDSGFIENRTYEEIQPGDSATGRRTLSMQDIQLFAIVSGDVNPAHLDPEYARGSMFGEVVGHGLWGGALISSVLGNELPGPGTIYVSQSLRFSRPVKVGDTLTVTVTCTRKADDRKRVFFDCVCANQHGKTVISGEAEVVAPTVKVRLPRPVMPTANLSAAT